MRSLGRNFEPIRYPMPKWVAARSRQLARISCIGDSTTAGNIGAKSNSFPNALATLLPGARADSIFGSNNAGATYGTFDPRVTLGAGWQATISGLAGTSWNNASTGNNFTVAFADAFDTIEYYYAVTAVGGAVDVDFDGGSATSISHNGSSNFTKTTLNPSLGVHTMNVRRNPASGTVYVWGLIPYDSTQKQILIQNMGWSGGTLANFTDASNPWTEGQASVTISADLTILLLGVNEWNTGVSLSTFRTNVQTAITQARSAGGDVLLIGGVASDPSAYATVDTQAGYRLVMRDLAQSNRINFFDMADAWGGFYASANARGYMADQRHPNGTGNSDLASRIARILYS